MAITGQCVVHKVTLYNFDTCPGCQSEYAYQRAVVSQLESLKEAIEASNPENIRRQNQQDASYRLQEEVDHLLNKGKPAGALRAARELISIELSATSLSLLAKAHVAVGDNQSALAVMFYEMQVRNSGLFISREDDAPLLQFDTDQVYDPLEAYNPDWEYNHLNNASSLGLEQGFAKLLLENIEDTKKDKPRGRSNLLIIWAHLALGNVDEACSRIRRAVEGSKDGTYRDKEQCLYPITYTNLFDEFKRNEQRKYLAAMGYLEGEEKALANLVENRSLLVQDWAMLQRRYGEAYNEVELAYDQRMAAEQSWTRQRAVLFLLGALGLGGLLIVPGSMGRIYLGLGIGGVVLLSYGLLSRRISQAREFVAEKEAAIDACMNLEESLKERAVHQMKKAESCALLHDREAFFPTGHPVRRLAEAGPKSLLIGSDR